METFGDADSVFFLFFVLLSYEIKREYCGVLTGGICQFHFLLDYFVFAFKFYNFAT